MPILVATRVVVRVHVWKNSVITAADYFLVRAAKEERVTCGVDMDCNWMRVRTSSMRAWSTF